MDKVIGEEIALFNREYHNRELTEFAIQTTLIINAVEQVKAVGIKSSSDGQEGVSFRDAVHDCMISTYDDEYKEKLDDSMKGMVSNDVFHEEVSAVFGSFLTDLYTDEREKFIELSKPIYEQYCKMKSEDDAHWKRERLKEANLGLIVNKKTHS